MSGVDLDFINLLQITWSTVTDNPLTSKLPKATQLLKVAHARWVCGHVPAEKFVSYFLIDDILEHFKMIFSNEMHFLSLHDLQHKLHVFVQI